MLDLMLRKSWGGEYKLLSFLLVAAMALVGSAALPSSADADVVDGDVFSWQGLQQKVNDIPVSDGKRHIITVQRTLTFWSSVTINQGKDVALVFLNNAELKHGYNGNFSLFSITGGSQLTLNGAAYNSQQNGRLANVEAGELTIDSGTYSGNKNQSGDAAVVYVSKDGTLKINGGTFDRNTSMATENATGGAVIHSSGKVTVNGGTFDGNSTGTNQNSNLSYHGGGVIWSDGTLVVNNGSFANNTSNAVHYSNAYRSPTGGGAIWASNHLVINGGTFQSNWQMDNTTLYATGGGAIYFGDGTNPGTMVINGGKFDGNRSMQDGGAIFMAWHSNAVFQQGTFTDNWSNRLGGAVYTEEETVSYVTNAAAYENHAGHFGGGLWLCPSGKGDTSEQGGMALFDNEANVDKYDSTEDHTTIWNDKQNGKAYNYRFSRNYGKPGAGDDFAIMYPNKGGGITNRFALSMKWFTGDKISWHDDGQPAKEANGFKYGYGGWDSNNTLNVNQMPRPHGGSAYTHDVVLTPGGKVDHGYGLKTTGITEQAKQIAKNQAFITFTNNTARLSGGAFGSDGNVTFTKVYGVSWNKVSSVNGNKKLSGSKWLLVAQNDDRVHSGPIDLDFGNVPECGSDGSGSITPTKNAWCKIPNSVTDDRYSRFTGKYVTVVADNSATDKDPLDGQFMVKGLRNGTYYLKEYQSPDGYTQSQKTYTFTINNADHPTISVSDNSGTSGAVLSGVSITNTPYGTVKWTKVDSADGQMTLSGSEWKLQNANGNDIQGAANITDCSGECSSTQDDPYHDIDPREGSFALTYLPLGSYRLVETKAPDGYDLPDGTKTYYTFTVTEDNRGNVPVYRSDGTQLNGNVVPNEHVTGSVTWYKTDSTKEGNGANARLEGSEWSLTKIKNWKGDDIASGQRQPITVTDCVSGAACPANSHDRDRAAGEFRMEDLDWGTYELVETKAPDGFKKSETVYTFVIDKQHNGTTKIQIMNGTDPVTGNIITNTPIAVSSLPFTGSGALTPYAFLPYVLGAVGAGLAVGLGLHMIRRRIARQG